MKRSTRQGVGKGRRTMAYVSRSMESERYGPVLSRKVTMRRRRRLEWVRGRRDVSRRRPRSLVYLGFILRVGEEILGTH